ncbi:MAG: phosphoglycerate kinase [Alphaproteobacteria bacterium]|nr:phosphoglycerate kinase [Alphaproteobacteria bacterium]
MPYQTLNNIDCVHKVVLLRVDLNVPITNNKVTDTTRIERLLPTIRELLKAQAKIVILSHFGRPKPNNDPALWDKAHSLKNILSSVESIFQVPVIFVDKCVGEDVQNAISAANWGSVILLENLRYYPGEEANDPEFAEQLAKLGDIYVNDAFSCSHRAHASVTSITQYLPSVAGRAMQGELEHLDKALTTPKHPVVAIVGGSKISTKLDLLLNLSHKVDTLVIGGGMANTMLAAQGIDVGQSLFEPNLLDTARRILTESKAEIILPDDVVVAADLNDGTNSYMVAANAIPGDQKVFDIGPLTVEKIKSYLDRASTIVWNGPVGAYEYAPFDQATTKIAQHVAVLTSTRGVISVAGGGETVESLGKAGVTDKFSYVSTAGGAFLEWLEGKTLPGVAALEKAGE